MSNICHWLRNWGTFIIQGLIGIILSFVMVILLGHVQQMFNRGYTSSGWLWQEVNLYWEVTRMCILIEVSAIVILGGLFLFIREADSRRRQHKENEDNQIKEQKETENYRKITERLDKIIDKIR